MGNPGHLKGYFSDTPIDFIGSCERSAPRQLRYEPMKSIGVSDRKSTRLNSSHGYISYAVFCLKKKTIRRAISVMTLILCTSASARAHSKLPVAPSDYRQ